MHTERLVLRARVLTTVSLALTVSLVAGCGSRTKETAEVSGTVSYKGQPVTAGVVKFFPEAGGDPAETPLGPDGTYRATGVPVGPCKVAVETLRFKTMTPPPPGMAKQMGGPRPVYVPIPEKYERPDSSGLTFDVKKGTSSWDIPLTD
jgi:hypothetical protein